VHLAERGWGLTISSRSADDLASLAVELRAAGAPQIELVAADLADPDSLVALVAQHGAAFGAMSALVLNAGMATLGPVESYPLRRFERTVAVNLTSAFVLTSAALPLLRAGAALDFEHGARIVALSSLTGLYSEPGLAVYGATKAALASFVETVNLDESVRGVTASAIAPGYLHTDMTTGVDVPVEGMIRVSDVVAVVEMLLSLSRNASITRIVLARSSSGGYRA
jgi:3-oxoacyl-[acyl-carrier protein] reductase